MIDPGLLGSIGPIVLGAGVGLAARRAIMAAERRHDAARRPAERVAAGPRIRPAVPAAGRR